MIFTIVNTWEWDLHEEDRYQSFVLIRYLIQVFVYLDIYVANQICSSYCKEFLMMV